MHEQLRGVAIACSALFGGSGDVRVLPTFRLEYAHIPKHDTVAVMSCFRVTTASDAALLLTLCTKHRR